MATISQNHSAPLASFGQCDNIRIISVSNVPLTVNEASGRQAGDIIEAFTPKRGKSKCNLISVTFRPFKQQL